MKYLRCFKTQEAFVEELTSNKLPLPRAVYIENKHKMIYGKMLENFILVNAAENAYLGDETGSFVVFKTR